MRASPGLSRLFHGLVRGPEFPRGSVGKEPACQAGDVGLIPGSRRSLGEGNGNISLYSCLANSMDRGGWRSTGHGVAKKSDVTWRDPRAISGNKKLCYKQIYHFHICAEKLAAEACVLKEEQ